MIAGQTLDINSTGVDVSLSLSKLKDLHSAKTGAMFRSAIQMGCVIAGEYNSSIYKTMTNVGNKLGLAFQVVDDILDVTRTTKELGKPSGSDIKLNKTTFPSLLGVEHSRTLSIELFDEAVELLHQTGAASFNVSIDPRDWPRFGYIKKSKDQERQNRNPPSIRDCNQGYPHSNYFIHNDLRLIA